MVGRTQGGDSVVKEHINSRKHNRRVIFLAKLFTSLPVLVGKIQLSH